MKNRDMENRILTALSCSDALDPHVTDAAKAEMRQTKPRRMGLANWVWATAVVLLLCLAVVLPLSLSGQSSPEKTDDISYSIIDSMQRYLDKNEIPLITLQKMSYAQFEMSDYDTPDDIDIHVGEYVSTQRKGDYDVTHSKVVYQNEQPMYLEEHYIYKKTEGLVICYVLLCAEADAAYFGEYLVLENEFSEPYLCPFRYNYDATTGRGYAITQSHGYTVCFSISSQTKDLFLSHLKNFAISQKD